MESSRLAEVLRRARSWPEDAQEELARVAQEIETELDSGTYQASPEELRGIDRGLRDAEQGRFATDSQIEGTFAKFRRG
jgi:predicted transcriptional regulator